MLTFNQVVPRSSRGRVTKLKRHCICSVFWFIINNILKSLLNYNFYKLLLNYSERNATTGSFFDAIFAGIRLASRFRSIHRAIIAKAVPT